MTISRDLQNRFLAALVLAFLLAASTALAGSVARLFYDDVAGTGVAALTNAPGFPNQPTFREQLDDFTFIGGNPLAAGLQGKDNSGTQFGSWVRGFLEAPSTGQYVFYIASDDASELWISADHREEGKRRIAYETGAGAPLFAGPRLADRQSQPVGLVRGRRYYFEVLHKQATGGSYLQVGWRRPDGVQEIIPALHLAQFPYDPYLSRGSLEQPPVFNASGLNGGDLPPDSVLEEGSNLLLQLDVIASQPTAIVWTLDGQEIPGEALGFLHLRRVPATLDGSILHAVISNQFGSVTSAPTVLRITRDILPPAVVSVDTGGNPNVVLVRFNEPVSSVSATNRDIFEIRSADGQVLPIETASLLADERTVELTGLFGFKVGGDYRLTMRDVEDLAVLPNTLSPNPSTTPFGFTPAAGITWDFDHGRPVDLQFFGSAKVVPTGGVDGSGFLELTDAFRNRNGAVLFSQRRDLDQVRIRFKVRISDGSETPAEGFSVNIANDLPLAILSTPEEGNLQITPGARLSFAFDAFSGSSADPASIAVIVNDQVVTNVVTAAGGIPPLYDAEGRWRDVDLDVRRGGRITIRWDGVTVLDQFPTDFEGIRNAQIGLAARTTANWETHWFDQLNLSFAEGDVGPVVLGVGDELGDRTVVENQDVRFSVLPSGASPYRYQWLRDGEPIEGETNRILHLTAALGGSGSYGVVVSNDFSGAVSVAARLTVLPDQAAPVIVSARGVAGGIREIHLDFDEPLDPESATRPETYSSPLLQILGASLRPDGRGVVLSTSGQRAGIPYTLHITGLKDRSSAGKALTTQVEVLSSIRYEEEVLSDRPSRFWRFEERSGSVALSSGESRDAAVHGVYVNQPVQGETALVPSQTNATSIRFSSASGRLITVPNGSDINVGGPWTKKSFEFWFQPAGVPAPGTTGLAAAKGIFEEGATARGILFYLWRDPENQNADEAELVFHAFNNASDGPGAPFGLTTAPAVYIRHTVRVGETHHVVGVFDGQSVGTSGELRLYVDGVEAGRAAGIGQIYAHTGDVQIGRGNGLLHSNVGGNLDYFDGALDEFALYSSVLPASRILAHYEAGIGKTTTPASPPTVLTGLDTRGNPDLVRLTFNQPVGITQATNLGNYTVQTSGGVALAVRSATLLGDQATVDLQGDFNFQPGASYSVTIQNLADQLDASNLVRPNPTVAVIDGFEGGPAALGPGSDVTDRSVVENLVTRFSVVASGAGPYTYQWLFKGQPLPGETNAVLEVQAAASTAGDYSVILRNEFSEVVSPAARLSLELDRTAPQVTAVRGIAGSLHEVRLSLSEPLEGTSATNHVNYDIGGLTLLSVTLSADSQEVILHTSPQTLGSTYAIRISGLKDRAATPNVLDLTTSFRPGISYRDEVLSDEALRYYPLQESPGTKLATLVTAHDSIPSGAATRSGDAGSVASSLIPNLPNDGALWLEAGRSNRVTIPNGSDLNISLGPWAKRSFVFAFRAHSLPRGGENPEAPLLFEEGANSRGLAFYLYGTQDVETPTGASLVFHGWNNAAADGPGSPWGGAQSNALSVINLDTPIQANQTYHVVGVLDGGTEDTDGELRLYVNGLPTGTTGGVGQIYNHSGDIAIGQSSSYLLHDGRYITAGGAYFDGVIDEFAVLGRALTSERIAALYAFSRVIPEPDESRAPEFQSVGVLGGSFILTWEGSAVLQRAPDAASPFEDVPGRAGRHEEPLTRAATAVFRLRR